MLDITRADENGLQTVLVAGECNIYSAAAFKDGLKADIDSSEHIAMDLSGVFEIDTSGVQVLILAKRECSAQNKEFKIVKMSRAVEGALELLNLTKFFKG